MSGRNARVIRQMARALNCPKRVAYRAWEAHSESIPHTQRLRPTTKYAKVLFTKLGFKVVEKDV